jgi:hypothetical protein
VSGEIIMLSTAAISLIEAIVAIICGHIAWRRIHASQGFERGEGFAVTGLVLGYLALVFVLLFAVFLLLLWEAAAYM